MDGSNLISSTARGRNELERFAPQPSSQALYICDANGFRKADERDVVVRAQEIVARRFRRGFPVLAHPHAVRTFLRLHMALLERMHFAALFLDRRRRLLAFHELFKGTVDEVNVHPREVVRDALAINAVHVIFLRNDPSGDPVFSESDASLWRRIREALKLMDIDAVDYMLIGARIVSCAQEGWIETQQGEGYGVGTDIQ